MSKSRTFFFKNAYIYDIDFMHSGQSESSFLVKSRSRSDLMKPSRSGLGLIRRDGVTSGQGALEDVQDLLEDLVFFKNGAALRWQRPVESLGFCDILMVCGDSGEDGCQEGEFTRAVY